MKRNIRYLSVLLGILVSQSACSDLPKEYSAEAIEAWVVDAESRRPIEGVIVTVNWQLLGGFEGGNALGQMKVMETVTDKTGRFYFPAWGPERRLRGYLREAPQLLLFKPGYEYRRLANEYRFTPGERSQKVRRSDWNSKMIEMRPFRGTIEKYAEHVYILDSYLEFARYGEDCEWKKIPRMLVTLHHMSESFESQGVKLQGWQIGARIRKVTDVGNEKQCGSPQEFFKNYQP